MSSDRQHDHFQVTAINPGSKKLKLFLLAEASDSLLITVSEPDGQQREVRVNSEIMLK